MSHNVHFRMEGMNLVAISLDADAQLWVQENVEDPMWFGDQLVVETRFALDLMYGMQQDGLVLATEGRVIVLEPK